MVNNFLFLDMFHQRSCEREGPAENVRKIGQFKKTNACHSRLTLPTHCDKPLHPSLSQHVWRTKHTALLIGDKPKALSWSESCSTVGIVASQSGVAHKPDFVLVWHSTLKTTHEHQFSLSGHIKTSRQNALPEEAADQGQIW